MQLTQATIAAGFAAHPALTAILFRTLPAHAYARATGFTAAAGVVAEVTSSLLGQLMLEGGAPLASLFVVSLASTCAAALVALALPSPRAPAPGVAGLRTVRSYARFAAPPFSLQEGMLPTPERSPAAAPRGVPGAAAAAAAADGGAADGAADGSGAEPPPNGAAPGTPADGGGGGLGGGVARKVTVWSLPRLLCADVLQAYAESGALTYYGWLSVTTAVHHLVITYWQLLPEPDHPHHAHHPPPPPHVPGGCAAPHAGSCVARSGSAYNGWVQAAAQLLGGAAALLPFLAERRLGARRCAAARRVLVVAMPLCLAGLLYAMASFTTAERDAYAACYVAFHTLFELMRVVCEAEGARCVARARYRGAARFALVGGINTAAALLLQTALQFGVGKQALHLPLPAQFKVFAAILVALFAGYALRAAAAACRRRPPADDDAEEEGAAEEGQGGAYVAYRNDDSS
jgi:hypothetical protein